MPVMSQMFRYVAIGDSTGVGTGAQDGGYVERLFQRLRATGVQAGLLNLCQNGATSRESCLQADRAASKQPAMVTLGVGANDVWRLTPVSAFEANLGHIGEVLEKSGASVVVCNIADMSLSPIALTAAKQLNLPMSILQARIAALNQCITAMGARRNFQVVDLFSPSQQLLPSRPELFSSDGFHPSAQGYDHWAEVLWPHVEAVARAWRSSAA